MKGRREALALRPSRNPVDTGTYFVSEVLTNASNYDTTLACFNDNGTGTGGAANDGIQNGTEPSITPAPATASR